MLVNFGRAAKLLNVDRDEIKRLVRLGSLRATATAPHGVPKIEEADLERLGRPCRVCGGLFFVPDDEYDWYMARGLRAPARCRRCRRGLRGAGPSTGQTAPATSQVRCAGCGALFPPVRPRQRHCRPSCRVHAPTKPVDLFGEAGAGQDEPEGTDSRRLDAEAGAGLPLAKSRRPPDVFDARREA